LARFISRYMNHRLKGPGGVVIGFQQNECITEDIDQIEYLRNHPDFGTIIFEDVLPAAGYICSNCGREFKSPQGYAAHIKSCKSKEESGEGDNEGEEQGEE